MKTNTITTLFASIVSCLTMSLSCTTTRESFPKEQPKDDIHKIIYYGTLAGNSHNTQPWIVEIKSATQFEVQADFKRKLDVVDDTARGLYISLGAFIENCVISANSLGYQADVKYTAVNNTDKRAAVITITPADKSGYSLINIERRRTLRIPFKKVPMQKDHLRALLVDSNPHVNYYSADSVTGNYIARNTLLAYTQQARDPKAQDELAKWFRFSNSHVKKERDGLTTSGMGIDGFAGLFVSNFMKPEDSKSVSFVDTGIKKVKDQLDSYAGWIVITQPADTPQYWMETGRLYERININCTENLIGYSPINALIEENNFEKKANTEIPAKERIQMIVRIGYVDSYPDAVSVRRSIDEIIK